MSEVVTAVPHAAVAVVACRVCGHVLSARAVRRYGAQEWAETPEDDREISSAPTPCSPAFAQWLECPDHPANGPDLGLSYSPGALPLLWWTSVIPLAAPAQESPDQ